MRLPSPTARTPERSVFTSASLKSGRATKLQSGASAGRPSTTTAAARISSSGKTIPAPSRSSSAPTSTLSDPDRRITPTPAPAGPPADGPDRRMPGRTGRRGPAPSTTIRFARAPTLTTSGGAGRLRKGRPLRHQTRSRGSWRAAGGLTPRGQRLLACRMNAHGLDQAGHLEDGANVLLECAETDVAPRGASLLHGRHEDAHARAVDVAHAAQIHDEPGLPLADQPCQRALDLVRSPHVQVALGRDHRHLGGLGHINIHAFLRSRTQGSALSAGSGAAAGAVLDDGPACAAFPGDVHREIIGNGLHQEEAVAAFRDGFEVRRLILFRLERLAEVLHLDRQSLVRGAHRDVDGLPAQALVGVLYGIVAQLADREEQVRLVLPRHPVAGELVAQPLAQAHQLPGLAGHGEGAVGARSRHSTVTLLARLRGWSTSEPLSKAV